MRPVFVVCRLGIETALHVQSIITFQDDVRYRDNLGVAMCTHRLALSRKHGFTSAYSSAGRFIAKIKGGTAATMVMFDFAPGKAVQVDFGAGPEIRDACTGKVVKIHFFMLLLA